MISPMSTSKKSDLPPESERGIIDSQKARAVQILIEYIKERSNGLNGEGITIDSIEIHFNGSSDYQQRQSLNIREAIQTLIGTGLLTTFKNQLSTDFEQKCFLSWSGLIGLIHNFTLCQNPQSKAMQLLRVLYNNSQPHEIQDYDSVIFAIFLHSKVITLTGNGQIILSKHFRYELDRAFHMQSNYDPYFDIPRWRKFLMILIYSANILVAGAISITSLFLQDSVALYFPWDQAAEIGNAMYMTGSHWLAIALISIFGLLVDQVAFSVVFIHQLIYKSTFLIVSVLPNLASSYKNDRIPTSMSIFFLVWVIILPFIIPWRQLLRQAPINPVKFFRRQILLK
ncbi:hypothetical protein FGO68_gene8725 [Halteria grandinella]|uniref:Uncharacterized protein n=1 Tax=Halteria grandinella TaxID=5974 RepID=A0A8J8T2M2_HALGN|nr:hypothetical protein FGO68_gene8725 [Halteria grandinella]